LNKSRLSRCYLLLCLPVFAALVGLVWGRPASTTAAPSFGLGALEGRYVSAEYGYDISSVLANGAGVYPPIWFAATSLMQSDGEGHVCGESDGFYSLMSDGQIPGGNTGPTYFHGTYTVDVNGRVTISTCSDTAFCATRGACGSASKVQVGYLQSVLGNTLTTVEQAFGSPPNFEAGFLVHSRVWTRDPATPAPAPADSMEAAAARLR
jgi:hypothetical protein